MTRQWVLWRSFKTLEGWLRCCRRCGAASWLNCTGRPIPPRVLLTNWVLPVRRSTTIYELWSPGLVELVELRRRRGCTERRLRPTARAYLISADFLEELAADPRDLQDRFSSDYLIALASRLVQEVAGLREAAARLNQRLPTLALQLDVSFDSAAARSRFAQELTDALAGLAACYQSRSNRSRPYRFMVGGHPRIQDKDVRPPGEEK